MGLAPSAVARKDDKSGGSGKEKDRRAKKPDDKKDKTPEATKSPRSTEAVELVGICHYTGNGWKSTSVAPAALPAHERHGDAVEVNLMTDPRHRGACRNECAEGATCVNRACAGRTGFVLSGGTDPDELIGVDDDLFIYVNGTLVFSDNNDSSNNPLKETGIEPITVEIANGDEIRVVAQDDVCCGRAREAVYLHNLSART